MTFDIITVGSATVDAFASTNTETVKVVKRNLCYPSGAKILLDQLHFRTGGGGTNTAVAFSRLGFKTAYFGRMGKYANSWRVIHELKQDKVNTSLISRSNARTGYSIILDAKGEDRTILAFKGSNNDLVEGDLKLSKMNCKLFYFSAMMEKSFKVQTKIAEFAQRKDIKIAYNPSSYLAKKGSRYLKPILSRTNILVVNKEEAKLIIKTKSNNINNIIKKIHTLGPEIIAITDGKKGSYASDGEFLYFKKAQKVKIIETTGAGDAFASGFVGGALKGQDIQTCLKMGTANAESVITHYGAKDELLTYRKMLSKIKDMNSVSKTKL